MRKFIENNTMEIVTIFFMLLIIKVVLFGYNLMGMYDFNNLFLG